MLNAVRRIVGWIVWAVEALLVGGGLVVCTVASVILFLDGRTGDGAKALGLGAVFAIYLVFVAFDAVERPWSRPRRRSR